MQKLPIVSLLLSAATLFCAENSQTLQPSAPVCLSNAQFKELLQMAKAGNGSSDLLEEKRSKSWMPSAETAVKVLAMGGGITATGFGIDKYKKELGALALVGALRSLLPAMQTVQPVVSGGLNLLGELIDRLAGSAATVSESSGNMPQMQNMAKANGSDRNFNWAMDLAKQMVLAMMQTRKPTSGHGNGITVSKL